MPDIPLYESDEVTVADSNGVNKLKVNADGSVNVNTATTTPATGTQVVVNVFSNVSSTTGIDTMYTITSGKTLTIQQMSGGAEPHSSGTIVELFEDPNGNLTPLVRIETVFVNGTSEQVNIQQSYVGNGTRRIVLRRRSYANSAREVWGRWTGYEI